ncbi:DUF362 domain-containing protein [Spirochaeta thermophila]|uniref:Iron-sulfur cluster-binding protein n=1 Tax=Winmispira thermophila (strain ATCC 49972 / DSM 6192 / RI 19.B1) TaxID=665571 RepID=E0RN28_WINT6|nr:DUF362 domain-containing protein [Spirochaeta thermophila]ADN02497.1 iron-sulfur cluster-binding protein [Spirochaeta thermophila DSM 6192]
MSDVVVVRVTDYDIEAIEGVVRGWVGGWVRGGERVLLKPNVLGAYPPERHVTTNPAVVEAVVRVLLDMGCRVWVGDSSGMPVHRGTARALEAAGMSELAHRYPVKVLPLEDVPAVDLPVPQGRVLERVRVSGLIEEVDWVVNLPKLKAHQLTRYTGAVKNLYGCVPGGIKQQYHAQAPTPSAFAHLLLDLYSALAPKLLFSLMDAVVSLEGSGPGPTGTPRRTAFLAFSPDAPALDLACCRAVGLDPSSVLHLRFAQERGLVGPLPGEAPEEAAPLLEAPMRFPGSSPAGWLGMAASRWVRSRPRVIEDRCRRCGYCARVCPVSCITMDGLPVWDYSRCIYCYCCHENCPHEAIELKEPLLLRLYRAFSGR